MALADEVIGVGIVAIEITDRKKAEQANRQLAAIVEQSGDAILGSTLDGIATSWNHAAEELLGYTAQEIIGHPLAVLAPPERADEQARMRARIIAGGPAERYETTRRCKDGSLVDVLITSSPATDESGKVIGVSVIVVDITERLRARNIALTSQRQMAEAQQIAHVGSFEKSFVTGEMTWSDELYRLLGVDPKTTPTLELFLSLVHPDDRARFRDAHAESMQRGTPTELTHRIVRADGELRWVESRAVCELGAGRHAAEHGRDDARHHRAGRVGPGPARGREPVRDRIRASRHRHRNHRPRRHRGPRQPSRLHAAGPHRRPTGRTKLGQLR